MLVLNSMRRSLLLVVTSLLGACAGSAQTSSSDAGVGTAPPDVSGQFAGTYDVPTPPALAGAATYVVERIAWTVSDGAVSLRYELPEELLGNPIALAFSGSIAADGSAKLTGAAGSATCKMSRTQVVCHEDLLGLQPLTPDTQRVAELAAQTYAGPPQDRVDVARLFSTDPIGVVTFELADAER